MNSTIINVIMFCLLGLFADLTIACGCSKPESIDEVKNYVHIFKGEVVSVNRSSGSYNAIVEEVIFHVLELIDGPKADDIKVKFRAGGTSCDLEPINFKVGDIYTISTFEYIEPKGEYFNNYCSLRIKNGKTI